MNNTDAPRPTRLLLVDDHPLVREGLKARLSTLPSLEVVGEAGDAQEAAEQVAATQPDLVLMDVGMKDVNGIDLTRQLLAERPDLLVLVLSMYDNPEYVNRAMQAGARGYVLKDAPASDIIDAIAEVMAGGTFLSSAVSGRLFRSQTPRPVMSLRESEILACLAKGRSSKQIAVELNLSVRTVESHRQNIKRKLNLDGQAELIKYAVEHCRDIGVSPSA
ncbi:response regulator transcription factor [Piscinibacter terrae]|uniref:DNA-binding response regulator n=1 Tax=Piscinibacter terrae TaxID=2496871 RepID=A0A3N7HRC4_9BURK|nr:response regulator transcription factor [Albitalea terrae]RQP24744.1 DNA-binding response regulator [Albitalea terrae]